MKTSIKILVTLIASVCLTGISWAQDNHSEDARSIETLVDTLANDIEAVRSLRSQVDAAGEASRSALVYRLDERINRLLRDYGSLASKVKNLPEGLPKRGSLTDQMSEFGTDLGPYLFQRLDDHEKRIDEQSALLSELSGTTRLAAQSSMTVFESSRIQSYQAIASYILSRELLGISASGLREQLTSRLLLLAETLSGRITSLGMAEEVLQNRLSLDPENADIAATLKELDTSHAFSLGQLEAVILMLDSLGLDSTEYQAVMLLQSPSISIRFFSSEAILEVIKAGWRALKKAVENNAADLTIRLLMFIAILLIFRVLARIIRRIVRVASDRSKLDMSLLLKNILVSTSGGTVMALGFLIALSTIGVSLAPMLAGLGVAGFIVGFALQDSLANFAAGAMILIYRPFDVDDLVEVPGAFGKVKRMNLVSTTITTLDNQTLVVPNSKIWGDVIKNVTAQKVRRVDLDIGIGYDDDIDLAEKVLTEIVVDQKNALTKPEPTIKLHTLGDSSVNFVVRVWTRTDDYWDVYWDILREVKVRFDSEGISIPFPQRDVHIYNEAGDKD